jgi:hypothetical protein
MEEQIFFTAKVITLQEVASHSETMPLKHECVHDIGKAWTNKE